MSRPGVMAVIEKVLSDEKFRELCRTKPDSALAQFDLTPEEAAALKSRDPGRLGAVGIEVDERIQKGSSMQ